MQNFTDEEIDEIIKEYNAGRANVVLSKLFSACTDGIKKLSEDTKPTDTQTNAPKRRIVLDKPDTSKKSRVKITQCESLCWKCQNSVPNKKKGTGCSWSIGAKFIPVDGWDVINEKNGVTVIGCPNFVRDTE